MNVPLISIFLAVAWIASLRVAFVRGRRRGKAVARGQWITSIKENLVRLSRKDPLADNRQ